MSELRSDGKEELYIASCLVIDPDHAVEREYLDRLARALELSDEFTAHPQQQARQNVSVAA